MSRYWVVIMLVVALAALLVLPVMAQPDQPVVFAVFFYSPTCPHCHEVITNHLPGIQQEFGDQFILLSADVSTPGGSALASAAYQAFNIQRQAVPMVIIGDVVLTGSVQIPERLPGLIRDGLANGGIGLPAIPGLQEAYDAYLAAQETQTQPQADTTAEATAPVPFASSPAGPTLGERLAADPLANALAVGVLLGLIFSLFLVLLAVFRQTFAGDVALVNWLKGRAGWLFAVVTSFITFGIALTLVSQRAADPLAAPLAWTVALMLLAITVIVTSAGAPIGTWDRRINLPNWLLPVVAVAGLAVALYLSHVEINQAEAACGAVGDCNTVQQSDYARLFGVLPVGVLGMIGYAAILLVWLAGHLKTRRAVAFSRITLLVLALLGTAFSIYLTFLEPFVIGATCAWCLTSALIMLLLLWLVAADGLYDLHQTFNHRAR